MPQPLGDAPLGAVAKAGPRLLDDDLMLPAAILKRAALDHNRAWMRAFTARFGLDFAPHAKTTMSPELIALQLADGAWGITAATAQHVRAFAEIGVPRIVLANQLVGRANIDAVLAILAGRPMLDFYCLVDSVAGVTMLADAVAASGFGRPVKVLIELGGAGERAGVRTLAEAIAMAQACTVRSDGISLVGVEAFEGIYGIAGPVESLLDRMVEGARQLDAAGLFTGDEVIVSAGGSLFLDLAGTALVRAAMQKPTRLVLRSGCYLTHDDRFIEDALAASLARAPELAALGHLQPALEVWAHVQSRPEPGRVVAALGKRDISYDIHPPQARWLFRRGRDRAPIALAPAISVAKLYDQHACLDVPPALDIAVGDLIGFGLSHPCTTFDKWRALFVVDDDYRVVDIVTTLF